MNYWEKPGMTQQEKPLTRQQECLDFLTLAADAEFRAFSGSEVIVEDGENFPLSENEEDLFQLRLGAEYLLVNDLGVFPIRAGFRSVPTLFADYDELGEVIGPTQGSGFSLGTGFITSRFALDFTYSASWYDQLFGTITKSFGADILIVSGIFYF